MVSPFFRSRILYADLLQLRVFDKRQQRAERAGNPSHTAKTDRARGDVQRAQPVRYDLRLGQLRIDGLRKAAQFRRLCRESWQDRRRPMENQCRRHFAAGNREGIVS